jgi:dolichol-phosphate mannosyltransferase
MAHASNVFKITPEATPYLIAPFKARNRKLWIVLPAFNEAENLGKLIENVFSSLHEFTGRYEVVVVDDGSQDSTKKVAESFLSQVPLTVLVHENNLGLGATMRDGFQYVANRCSTDDIVVAMDADNTHNPGLIPNMVNCISEGNDVVIASRYQNGSYIRGVSGLRQLLSLAASFLFRVCFPVKGVKDYTCGYRAYRADLIQKAFQTYGKNFINQNGFECMVDILIKLRKLDAIFREVPLILRYDLKEGESKMKVARTILRSLLLIAKHRFIPQVSV